MSKARDALYDLINEAEIGDTWEDLQFYINGKLPSKADLRRDMQELFDLLHDCTPKTGHKPREGELKQLELKLTYKKP
jgi:hypothetical protein